MFENSDDNANCPDDNCMTTPILEDIRTAGGGAGSCWCNPATVRRAEHSMRKCLKASGRTAHTKGVSVGGHWLKLSANQQNLLYITHSLVLLVVTAHPIKPPVSKVGCRQDVREMQEQATGVRFHAATAGTERREEDTEAQERAQKPTPMLSVTKGFIQISNILGRHLLELSSSTY